MSHPRSELVPQLAELMLTPRLIDVLALLLQGKSNKAIARDLFLSTEAVREYVATILHRLGVSSRAQVPMSVRALHDPLLAWDIARPDFHGEGSEREPSRFRGWPDGRATDPRYRVTALDPKMPLPRRVWRMTADAPHGEVLELLPRAAESRPSSPGTRAGTPSGGRLTGEVESSPDESAKVLTPAKAPTWQASSFDLMTGATAEEVTDTIPGDLYDELFPTRR